MSGTTQQRPPRVVLGKRPKSFSKTVEGRMADGTLGAIDMTFTYRTRTEWGALLDRHKEDKAARTEARLKQYLDDVQQARATGAPMPTAASAEQAQRADVEADARLVLDIATGWDLPDPFNFDSLMQLADEAPDLIAQMVRAYGEAVHEGRLGN